MLERGWINLLSGRALDEFAPEEFKLYVKSLKVEPPQKKIRLKIPKPPFKATLTKTGKISVKFNRTGKWLSRAEIAEIAKSLNIEETRVWVELIHRKRNPVRLSDAATEENTSDETNPLPF